MGQVDVLAYLDAQIASHKALSADAFHQQELSKAQAVRAVVASLLVYADSALEYVDDAAAAERARHRVNGAPNSQVIAQTVADNLRAALAGGQP